MVRSSAPNEVMVSAQLGMKNELLTSVPMVGRMPCLAHSKHVHAACAVTHGTHVPHTLLPLLPIILVCLLLRRISSTHDTNQDGISSAQD